MDQATLEKSFLPVREWAAVLVMLFILASLSTLSFTAKSQATDERALSIQVHIVGEVEKETLLEMPYGATIGDALSKVALTSSTDVDRLTLDAQLKHGQILVIPKKGVVSVYLKGAVQKTGVLHLQEAATFRDLQQVALFDDTADMKAFKRKTRKLKDGEVITIASLRIAKK
jgi:hypothetical protein